MYVHNPVGRFSMARSLWARVYRPCIVVSPEAQVASRCCRRVEPMLRLLAASAGKPTAPPALPEGEAPSLASPSSPSNGISRRLSEVLSQ